MHRGGLHHRGQSNVEPIVEAALLDRLPGGFLVGTPQTREGTLAPQPKAEHERPEQIDDVDLTHTLCGSRPARQIDEERRRKQLAQHVMNRYGWGRGHPAVSLGLDTRT